MEDFRDRVPSFKELSEVDVFETVEDGYKVRYSVTRRGFYIRETLTPEGDKISSNIRHLPQIESD